jgi:ATP-binding protein involved in chromosome partitioning
MAYCNSLIYIQVKVMALLTAQQVENHLGLYTDPYLKQDLRMAKVIRRVEVFDESIRIQLVYGFPQAGVKTQLIAALIKYLQPLTGTTPVEIEMSWEIASHAGTRGLKGLPQVKNIIAIASGKGGVGKSTTAVNLTLALAAEGARAGILDADIYGPSQPLMLGAALAPGSREAKVLLPVMSHGVQSMSIGYLIDEKAPMVWRGPMVSMALQQLLHDTLWDDLDYLVIDLPPGTGDIQLTLAQKIPVSGALIVTTPQDLALMDARRAYEMFLKVHVPVLGVIENMSVHVCGNCGHAENIFGIGGGEKLAAQYGIELIASLPLDKKIREQTDGGTPTVAADPDGANATLYREAARQIAAKLSLQTKDYSHRFPNIVVTAE